MKTQIFLLSLIMLLLLPLSGLADSPTTKPMLRRNGVMHSAAVNRISGSADGRTFLTCSDDKTAKLWDGVSGQLLHTFHPPVGLGHEGKLFSCALSADGRLAAMGGWTSKDGLNNSIYIFNTSSKELVQRLTGLANVISDLEFHPNGTLAAALVGANGIRIYQAVAGRYREVARDTDYGDHSYNLAFDPAGRLASVSFDGYLRLYDRKFELIHKVKTRGGSQPFSLAFSPSGDKLAVGYFDAREVDVYDGRSLAWLHSPDVSGIGADDGMYAVAFDPAGSLYGGGSYSKVIDGEWWMMIRKWPAAGQGSFTDFKGGNSTIMDLKPLADKGLLMAGYQPDMASFSLNGQRRFYQAGELADFINYQFKYFSVNRDGSRVSFKPKGQAAMVFDLKNRELRQSTTTFRLPKAQVGSTRVTDWEDSTAPRLNDQPTSFLRKYETSRAADISPDGDIVFGAEWSVYALTGNGTQKWRADVPGIAWAVKVAGDGRTVVAAHDGGELRWYRMSDGQLLLSLFVHSDGRRWVLYSPEGYYDAAPGADELMGWHINRGADQAAGFYPIGKFAKKYYRPDVIAAILKTCDFDQALDLANKASKKRQITADLEEMLPPDIIISSPENGQVFSKNEVVIRYRIKNPSGEKITGVKALIDGRPVGSRDIKRVKKEGKQTMRLNLPSRDVEVTLIAENRFAAGNPATIHLKWQGAEEFVIKPNLYVLAIGVSDYKDKSLQLAFAAKDARDFAGVLAKQKNRLYRDVVVKVIADTDAIRGEILDGLEWILHETTQKDVAMVFLAGHGVNDDYGNYYYLPRDVDTNRLRRTAVAYADIKDTVSNIAGKALFFIDTCHSGNVLGKRRGVADTNGIINELTSAENGVVVFASSTGRQYSLEDRSWSNGAFTKAVVEGFSGKAAYRGDKITLNMLDLYISERVKALTNGRQTPTTAKPNTISDFPIAVK